MFRIGEFSRIARVSGRLLRYYDSIGLFSPSYTDPVTGYRYYKAGQLAQLNRILALKDLGLSLEQVGRMIDEEISAEEVRGMLMLKRAELERSLSDGIARLRHIESRLRQIDEQGSLRDYDVILKSASAQPYLSLRRTYPGLEHATAVLREVAGAAQTLPRELQPTLVVVAHSDYDDEDLDLEIGLALDREPHGHFQSPGIAGMTAGELPASDALATLVRSGPLYESHLAFGALGLWMEANALQIAGPSREVFLGLPLREIATAPTVMEVQFPVVPSHAPRAAG
ncbi:MAG: MerR family transcriptional regulator [Steroidobacteraceae bacterium]